MVVTSELRDSCDVATPSYRDDGKGSGEEASNASDRKENNFLHEFSNSFRAPRDDGTTQVLPAAGFLASSSNGELSTGKLRKSSAVEIFVNFVQTLTPSKEEESRCTEFLSLATTNDVSSTRKSLKCILDKSKAEALETFLKTIAPLKDLVTTLKCSVDEVHREICEVSKNLDEDLGPLQRVDLKAKSLYKERDSLMLKKKLYNEYFGGLHISEKSLELLTSPYQEINDELFKAFEELLRSKSNAEWVVRSLKSDSYSDKGGELLQQIMDLCDIAFERLFSKSISLIRSSYGVGNSGGHKPIGRSADRVQVATLQESFSGKEKDQDVLTPKSYLSLEKLKEDDILSHSSAQAPYEGSNISISQEDQALHSHQLTHSGLNELLISDADKKVLKVLSLLRDRLDCFNPCVKEIAKVRRYSLLHRFHQRTFSGTQAATTAYSKNPMDLLTYDPFRYISDMLVWIHEQASLEMSFAIALKEVLDAPESADAMHDLPYYGGRLNSEKITISTVNKGDSSRSLDTKLIEEDRTNMKPVKVHEFCDKVSAEIQREVDGSQYNMDTRYKPTKVLATSTFLSVSSSPTYPLFFDEDGNNVAEHISPSSKSTPHTLSTGQTQEPVEFARLSSDETSSVYSGKKAEGSKLIGVAKARNNYVVSEGSQRASMEGLPPSEINMRPSSRGKILEGDDVYLDPQYVLDYVFEGICHPFKTRVQQCLAGRSSIIIIFKLYEMFSLMIYAFMPHMSIKAQEIASRLAYSTTAKKLLQEVDEGKDRFLYFSADEVLNCQKDSSAVRQQVVESNGIKEGFSDISNHSTRNYIDQNGGKIANLLTTEEETWSSKKLSSLQTGMFKAFQEMKRPIFVETLESLKCSAYLYFNELLEAKTPDGKGLPLPLMFSPELTPPQFVVDSTNILKEILDIYQCRFIPFDNDFSLTLDALVNPVINFSRKVSTSLPSPDRHIYLINSFWFIQQALTGYEFSVSKVNLIVSLIEEQMNILVKLQAEMVLDSVGFLYRLQALQRGLDQVNKPPATLEAFQFNSLSICFHKFYALFPPPEKKLHLRLLDKLMAKVLRKEAQKRVSHRILDGYKILFEFSTNVLQMQEMLQAPNLIRSLLEV